MKELAVAPGRKSGCRSADRTEDARESGDWSASRPVRLGDRRVWELRSRARCREGAKLIERIVRYVRRPRPRRVGVGVCGSRAMLPRRKYRTRRGRSKRHEIKDRELASTGGHPEGDLGRCEGTPHGRCAARDAISIRPQSAGLGVAERTSREGAGEREKSNIQSQDTSQKERRGAERKNGLKPSPPAQEESPTQMAFMRGINL
ncbi:hypothetical protein FB451DRAFT_1178026 [Mycena latifolia]|nr:hypothetical protein FB451DRAFT_1178026 [Mycena latifolia]